MLKKIRKVKYTQGEWKNTWHENSDTDWNMECTQALEEPTIFWFIFLFNDRQSTTDDQ